jgi:ERCC4-related helicase
MPLIKQDSITRRRYQEEIFDACKDSNSLVVLPTGLGKTVIAAMVTAHRLLTHPTSKAVFLAPTKPLVRQHREKLHSIVDLDYEDMSFLTGETKAKERVAEWQKGRIVFATPQVIQRDILKGRYNLENVSLLVIDEAHRAVGNYAYVQICKEYFQQASNPQVIGLTASPGWSQDEISQIRENLKVKNIEARTEMSSDVAPYVKPLEMQWIRVQLGQEFSHLSNLIDEMMDERLKALMDYGLIDEVEVRRRSRRAMIDLQASLAKETRSGPRRTPLAMYQGMTLTGQIIRLSYIYELLNTQGLYALGNYLEKLVVEAEFPKASNALKELVADARFALLSSAVKGLQQRCVKHPKLVELVRILKEEIGRKPASRTLVFAQFRDTVKQIVEELKSHSVSACAFIGQRKGRGFIGMTQLKQVKALRDFKDGLYSTLVATSVAEEGLDIAECDLVILYDAVPSEVRYIQRRGRVGRHDEARVVTLITAGTQDETYYLSAVSKEKKMRDNISRIKEVETTRIEDFVFGKPAKENDALHYKDIKPIQRSDGSSHDNRSGSVEGDFPRIELVDAPRQVIVNKNLENSELFLKLKECGLNPATRTTRGADLIIGNEVGIIYVRRESSANNGSTSRLLCQNVEVLKETFRVPMVIYESKSIEPDGTNQARNESTRKIMAYFILCKHIHFAVTRDDIESADLINSMARVALD